jgi:cytochrome P450
VPFSADLDHLPGASGLLAGARTVLGMMTRGEDHFSKLAARHGPVFRHMIAQNPVVFVADPDHVWTVARNDDGSFSAPLAWRYFFGGSLPGDTVDGLLTLDFDRHRDARRLLQPAFSAQAIAGYVEAAHPIFASAIDGWIAKGRVRFKAEVRRLFARVSAKIFMGIDDPAEAERLDRAMSDGWRAVLAILKRSALSPSWRRAKRGHDVLWSTLRPRIDERRGGDGADLLSRLCAAREDAAWLDDDTRTRLFIAVMFGAFDTTASGAASMAYLLAKHPGWQERLREEARGLSSDASSVDELKTLEALDWVWKETLRLFPVAGQITRQTLREVRLGEHRIPPAAFVWALAGTASNDPKWWTSPRTFDPERFSPGRAEDKRHKATFLPFGAGAHACIGAQLAGVEIRAFFAAMLRRCRFRLARDYDARHCFTPIGIVSGDVALEVERI